MQNKRLRAALEDFFGEEPLLTAAIGNTSSLAQLILRSCSLAGRPVFMSNDEYNKLSQKY